MEYLATSAANVFFKKVNVLLFITKHEHKAVYLLPQYGI